MVTALKLKLNLRKGVSQTSEWHHSRYVCILNIERMLAFGYRGCCVWKGHADWKNNGSGTCGKRVKVPSLSCSFLFFLLFKQHTVPLHPRWKQDGRLSLLRLVVGVHLDCHRWTSVEDFAPPFLRRVDSSVWQSDRRPGNKKRCLGENGNRGKRTVLYYCLFHTQTTANI